MAHVDRPYAVTLSQAELEVIQDALWIWEDSYRHSRLKAKAAGKLDDAAIADRKIAGIRNLKARMFRAKKRAR